MMETRMLQIVITAYVRFTLPHLSDETPREIHWRVPEPDLDVILRTLRRNGVSAFEVVFNPAVAPQIAESEHSPTSNGPFGV